MSGQKAAAAGAVEWSGSGRRLPVAPDGASTHAPVSSVELETLSHRLEKLSTMALDVRRLPSGRERGMKPAPPMAGLHRAPRSPRASARAQQLAAALHGTHTAREQHQIQAAATAMRQPVEEASRQLIDRMAQLEKKLIPQPKPPSQARASSSLQAVGQKPDLEPLDRKELGEDFETLFTSPRTAIFSKFAAVAGAARVVAKMKTNHEATKADRSESSSDCPHSHYPAPAPGWFFHN